MPAPCCPAAIARLSAGISWSGYASSAAPLGHTGPAASLGDFYHQRRQRRPPNRPHVSSFWRSGGYSGGRKSPGQSLHAPPSTSWSADHAAAARIAILNLGMILP